jgi:hypothetical protein
VPAFRAPLHCHAQANCAALESVEVIVEVERRGLALRYELRGDLTAVRIPSAAAPLAADRLWAHTCCEVFVTAPGADAYAEWNFSPSGQIAHDMFSSYRVRASDAGGGTATIVHVEHGRDRLRLDAHVVPAAHWGTALALGVAVVVEDHAGLVTHWALRHRPDRPDFHHRDTFALDLDLDLGPAPAPALAPK